MTKGYEIIQKHQIPGEPELTRILYQQTIDLTKAIFPTISDLIKIKIMDVTFLVIYKLGAIKYHHDSFLKEWGERFDKVSQQEGEIIVEETTLAYELEGFIFQIKSCLDAVVKILDPMAGITLNTYGDYGDSGIKALNNNLKNKQKPREERLKKQN